MDRTELENALRERCPSFAEQVIAAIEPCLRLDTEPGDDAPVGVSKLGGDPDLPTNFEWPTWEEGPLDFLAQIDLTQIDTSFGLPDNGVLVFFADVDACFGLSQKDKDGFRIVWTDAELERRPAPEDAERFACGRIAFRNHLSVPPLGAVAVGDVDVPDEEADALDDIRREFGGYEAHQLLGHADFIQHPIEEETVQAITGCSTGGAGFDTKLWAKVKDQTKDWRLLLQIASDGELDYMWGDAGLLYFAIRRDALARPLSENAWYIFQCS